MASRRAPLPNLHPPVHTRPLQRQRTSDGIALMPLKKWRSIPLHAVTHTGTAIFQMAPRCAPLPNLHPPVHTRPLQRQRTSYDIALMPLKKWRSVPLHDISPRPPPPQADSKWHHVTLHSTPHALPHDRRRSISWMWHPAASPLPRNFHKSRYEENSAPSHVHRAKKPAKHKLHGF